MKYINEEGEVWRGDGELNKKGEIIKNATMKNKGVPQKCLKPEHYDGQKHTVEYDSLKKKHSKLSKKDVKTGVQNFSIVKVNCKKTINKSSFAGMNFINGEWYPRGYVFPN